MKECLETTPIQVGVAGIILQDKTYQTPVSGEIIVHIVTINQQ